MGTNQKVLYKLVNGVRTIDPVNNGVDYNLNHLRNPFEIDNYKKRKQVDYQTEEKEVISTV